MVERLQAEHRSEYLAMSGEFYDSTAVSHSIPLRYRERAFAEAVSDSPYVEGYRFSWEGQAAGFALLSKTFSQEAGGYVLWLEDFYIRPPFRGRGLGSAFLRQLRERLGKDYVRLRLEIMPENHKARALYQRWCFREMPYRQYMWETAALEAP